MEKFYETRNPVDVCKVHLQLDVNFHSQKGQETSNWVSQGIRLHYKREFEPHSH